MGGLREATPGWPGVGIDVELFCKTTIGRWSEHIACVGSVFLAYQDLKSFARPGKMFAHASDRVSLNHGGNASVFERGLGELSVRAAAVGSDDNELTLVHTGIMILKEHGGRT
jgi:hypothetical protein